MNVLIACEESQAITKEFRKLGVNCFSCDIVKCSGDMPQFHIKDDCLKYINGDCNITTEDGSNYYIDKWDLIIAHPPCTYLTVTGNRWFNIEKYGNKAIERMKERKKAIDFFLKFTNASCKHVMIENPVGVMSTIYRKPDQIIQPWMFGDEAEKKTCLWLKNLPLLKETEIVKPPERIKFKSGKTMPAWYAKAWKLSKEERSKLRSKTFPGFAKAIAHQYYNYIITEENKHV